MTEDKMVGWYHRFNGHEFEQTPGDSEEIVKNREARHAAAHGVTRSWTTTNGKIKYSHLTHPLGK